MVSGITQPAAFGWAFVLVHAELSSRDEIFLYVLKHESVRPMLQKPEPVRLGYYCLLSNLLFLGKLREKVAKDQLAHLMEYHRPGMIQN